MHAVLIVAEGLLRAVVHREDVHEPAPAEQLAWRLGALRDRIVSPDEDLEAVRTRMLDAGVRRLAVVDEGGRLLGLLCLKRSHRGFCSAADVAARARATTCSGPIGDD
ncbi:hypothetical protein GCM10023175_67420 [Pseudonocardia xishanensis]|uniref:CBS domain-containing protein n=2 Tax=Pseudonocardia xishanensis TaxID=630995 RepID=A0ABP8S3V8_9PSEU